MPKLVDHVSYRKQLLAQCFDLFAERGYSSLTTRQIADVCRILKSKRENSEKKGIR